MTENVNKEKENIKQQIKNLTDIREILVILLGFIDKLENKMVQERKRNLNERQ